MASARDKKIAILFLALGGALGFGAGVLSVKGAREAVKGMFASEQRADVSKPTTIERPTFRLQHPSNWKVDTKDTDYDPDHMFSIETPGQSFVMFVVADALVDSAQNVETHASAQTSKVMKDAARTPFTKWGSFTGEGVLLRGKLLGITPGTIRIFSWQSKTQSFTVIESTFDDDRASVSPGFELVERTFRVND